MKLRFAGVLLLLTVITFLGFGQRMMGIVSKKPIICYADPVNRNTSFGPPEEFLKKRSAGTRAKTSTITVEYVGFDAQAQNAFQFAVDIWESLIESPVPIRIRAFWRPLNAGVLGSAIWANAFANFDNAQNLNTFYPVALAEKIAGKQLNHPDSVDIFANFNSNASWYYGTTGTPPVNTHDLVSVVLHEIGHGLGFVDSYNFTSGQGSVGINGSGVPFVYDLSLENSIGQNIFTNFTSPSIAMGTQLTSNNLFFNSPTALPKPRLFAPASFDGGSSIAHLDETTYPAGSPNSLMSPQIGFREVMHDPGPLVKAMFSDMGWVLPRQVHTPKNLESVINPITLLAKIEAVDPINASYTYQPASVRLTFAKRSNSTDVVVNGIATGNPHEFSFTIPATSVPDTVFYFLTVTDNLNRTYTSPGKTPKPVQQGRFVMGIGPDVKAPEIAHTPKLFMLASETALDLSAIISDNIGIQQAQVEYAINGVPQSTVNLTPDASTIELEDGFEAWFRATYNGTLTFSPGLLNDGDVITYRIKATDNSSNSNVGFNPATTSYQVNVVALAPTQNSYSNNFNSSTNDFFGDPEFSVITPTGFTDGAIHTVHPYPNGSGPDNESNFVYQLRVPIRLKNTNALLRFDEIVLVEPGEAGAAFGSDEFFDYVVVEGSKDGGATWKILADGYDSRAQSTWLTRYNSSNDGANPPNSNATGIPSLFVTRTIDMLANGNFKAGDEMVIRFRLFADQLVHGWGWAIDNLKIQIDETPPIIRHNHLDFLPATVSSVSLPFSISDESPLTNVAVEYTVNAGSVTTINFPVNTSGNEYVFDLTLNGLNTNDVFKYRIRSSDNLGNEGLLPTTDFFQVPLVSFSASVNQYISDFDTPNTDFVGNFFSVSQPVGFNNGAIHSSHPYLTGFGTTNNGASDFTYTLTKPINISSTNPNIFFDEIALIEFNTSGNAIKDFVNVEGSKDNGITWEELVAPYSGNANSAWRTPATGVPALFRPRLIDMTRTGKFIAGDKILVRFKLRSDAQNNRWGWAIDNLSIQGPITGVTEKEWDVSVYPNPVETGLLTIDLPGNTGEHNLRFMNLQGQIIREIAVHVDSESRSVTQDVSSWPTGMYLLQWSSQDYHLIKKVIIRN